MSADRKVDFGNQEVESNSIILKFGYDSGGLSDEQIDTALNELKNPELLGDLADKIRIRRDGIDNIEIISGDPKNPRILEVAEVKLRSIYLNQNLLQHQV